MSERFMPALRAWRLAVLISSLKSCIDGGEMVFSMHLDLYREFLRKYP